MMALSSSLIWIGMFSTLLAIGHMKQWVLKSSSVYMDLALAISVLECHKPPCHVAP
jgi:hypothetical protein